MKHISNLTENERCQKYLQSILQTVQSFDKTQTTFMDVSCSPKLF